MSELWYDSFDAYVADHPDAERLRDWLTGLPRNGVRDRADEPLLIVRGDGPHGGIVGGYVWAHIRCIRGYPESYLKHYPDARDRQFDLMVHDCDDGVIVRNCKTLQEAIQWMDHLKDLCPVDMFGLPPFGFQWE